jgi:hypothetical protein
MATNQMNGACTIVSPNYLPFARTLAKSYLEHHPGDLFSVLVVANIRDKTSFEQDRFTVVFLDEIGLTNIPALAMKFDILELNTNVKPTFMKYLLRQGRVDKLIYLDPDICVYGPLVPIFDFLESNNVVLTPHITSPVPKSVVPSEQEFLQSGTYNLGAIGVKRSATTASLLAWWETRCLEQGFSERRTGLFVDQKWMNLASSLFEQVAECKHPGCNMAYWNLHERVLSQTGRRYFVNRTDDLCFYHFSGIAVDDSNSLSKYSDSYTLDNRPDLRSLFAQYKAEVILQRNISTDAVPYGFDHFTDGTAVTKLARRIFAAHEHQFTDDPFQSNGAFYNFAYTQALIRPAQEGKSAGLREFDPKDKRVVAVNCLLKLALRILGPYRYESAMKYLAYIAILRNQGAFIKSYGSDRNSG